MATAGITTVLSRQRFSMALTLADIRRHLFLPVLMGPEKQTTADRAPSFVVQTCTAPGAFFIALLKRCVAAGPMRGAACRTARSAAGHKPYSRCSAAAVSAQASGIIASRPRRTTALCSRRRRRRYPWRRRGQGGNRCAEALGCCCSCCTCCCCLHPFTFVLLPCGKAFDGFFQVSIMIPTAGWSTFRGGPWMACGAAFFL